MFAQRSLFEDDRPAAPSTPSFSEERPTTASYRPGTASTTLADDDDPNAAETPAMKRKKLLERQQAMLAARKDKLKNAGIVRVNENSVNRPTSASTTRPTTATIVQPKRIVEAKPEVKSAATPTPVPASTSRPGMEVATPGSAASTPTAVTRTAELKDVIAEKEKEKELKGMSEVERDMLAQGIAPVFDPVKRGPAAGKIDFTDMRTALTSPVPKGIVLQCYILRNKKGLSNKMYPMYELYLEEEDKFLMAGKKRSKNKTSNYLLSMDKKSLDKDSSAYLGKLRSNFVGTEFVMYDKGLNPKDVDPATAAVSLLTVRQELGVVLYESNILGSRGPRKMTAMVPTVKKDGTRTIYRPMKEAEGMLAQYKGGNASDMLLLQNKTPKWNEQVGAYVLNFNGRVTMASVKNFQLISSDDPENVLLQFGRIAKDTFTMDVQWPLSPLQAFSICLSSFDYKLACE